MSNGSPFEVIAAPYTLYLAPVGTAFPAIAAAPASPWVKIGTSGDLNYMEEGVTVQHSQTIELWRALGDPGPRKAFRTEEGLLISVQLADLTLEQYALALNHNAVTETANVRKIGLSRGVGVEQRALLARGPSPYDEGLNAQYEVPIAVQMGEPEVVFRRGGEPAALALQWAALIDVSADPVTERFGRLLVDDGAT